MEFHQNLITGYDLVNDLPSLQIIIPKIEDATSVSKLTCTMKLPLNVAAYLFISEYQFFMGCVVRVEECIDIFRI